jgi:epsin
MLAKTASSPPRSAHALAESAECWRHALLTPDIVRVAAKEITALILDDERLRAERTDRRSWKSRVTGLEDSAPPLSSGHDSRPRDRPRRQDSDEDDVEYRLAIEASKAQEEEDKRKRESRQTVDPDDEDLQKALQLSKEEEANRRKELDEAAIFDDLIDPNAPAQSQPQPTGFGNQGYQQGNPVDFFANPIDPNQMPGQPTGYAANAYTGYQQQQPQMTGYPGMYVNGYGMPTGAMQTGLDPYGQQQQLQQQQFQQPQPTGYNPYLQPQQQQQPPPQMQLQVQSPSLQEPSPQPGSNNPWATGGQSQQSLKPTPTGSNNPFATQFSRPQTSSLSPGPSNLGSLPEQQTLSKFNPIRQASPRPQQYQQQQQQAASSSFGTPQKEVSEHEARLNSLLASGEGQDTFGNTGNLRIPAQHTAPGTFVNSAGAGISRLASDATGHNPFLRTQFTGAPGAYGQAPAAYGQVPAATGPAGMQGNPFTGNKPGQSGDLIQL